MLSFLKSAFFVLTFTLSSSPYSSLVAANKFLRARTEEQQSEQCGALVYLSACCDKAESLVANLSETIIIRSGNQEDIWNQEDTSLEAYIKNVLEEYEIEMKVIRNGLNAVRTMSGCNNWTDIAVRFYRLNISRFEQEVYFLKKKLWELKKTGSSTVTQYNRLAATVVLSMPLKFVEEIGFKPQFLGMTDLDSKSVTQLEKQAVVMGKTMKALKEDLIKKQEETNKILKKDVEDLINDYDKKILTVINQKPRIAKQVNIFSNEYLRFMKDESI